MARLGPLKNRQRVGTDPDRLVQKSQIETTLLLEQANIITYHLIINQEKLKEHLDINGKIEVRHLGYTRMRQH